MRRSTIFTLALLTTGGLLAPFSARALGEDNAAAEEQVAAPAAAADAKQPNASDDKGKQEDTSAVAQFNQGMQLVQYARENESPLAMLAAVEILRGVPVTEDKERFAQKEAGEQADGQQATGTEKGDTPAPSHDIQALLKEARQWAGDDEHVVALIDAEAAKPQDDSEGTLGAPGGPIIHFDTVPALSYITYTIAFNGGELASVAVSGDGDTDLDLFIIDENGNEIVRDTDRSDDCVAEWVPRWTGTFYVRVTNLGLVYNNFVLGTN